MVEVEGSNPPLPTMKRHRLPVLFVIFYLNRCFKRNTVYSKILHVGKMQLSKLLLFSMYPYKSNIRI